METEQLQNIYDQLIRGIKKYFKKAGYHRAVIGVSGGVDSSLTLKLGVDALDAENITAISMPELGVSSQENIDHAKALCHALNVKFFYQPLNQFLTDFHHLSWDPNKLATQNSKARMRAVLLYNYANTAEALVLGTSNKSETLLGYGTKYGDLAADIEVIGDLYKEARLAARRRRKPLFRSSVKLSKNRRLQNSIRARRTRANLGQATAKSTLS